jgi:hypothetical protein
MRARMEKKIVSGCSVKCLTRVGRTIFLDRGNICVCLTCSDTVLIFRVYTFKNNFTSKHEGYCADLSLNIRMMETEN